MRKIIAIIIIIGLTGCSIDSIANLQNGANVIASKFKSKDIKVGRSFYTDSQKGKQNSLTVLLEDVDVIEKEDYPKQKVASISAKLLVDNIKKEDIGDAEIVVVTISSKNQKHEFKYLIADLIKIDAYISIVKSYLNDINTKNYDNLINYIDTTRMRVTDHYSMVRSFKQNDSIMGPQGNIIISGFDITSVTPEKIPVIEIWAQMSTNKYFNRYHFYLNNDKKEIKVLYVGLNDQN